MIDACLYGARIIEVLHSQAQSRGHAYSLIAAYAPLLRSMKGAGEACIDTMQQTKTLGLLWGAWHHLSTPNCTATDRSLWKKRRLAC